MALLKLEHCFLLYLKVLVSRIILSQRFEGGSVTQPLLKI